MKISNKYLRSGMELQECLENLNLDSGTILTSRIISKIKKTDINYVDIKVSSEFDTFNDSIKELIKSILRSDDVNELHDLALLLTEIVESSGHLKFDTSIYLKNSYCHIANTIIISALLAKKYNEITEQNLKIDIESTIYAAILEDIGRRAKNTNTLKLLKDNYEKDLKEFKKLIPDLNMELLDKYDSKYHPIYSYFFCKYYKTSENVKMAVLLHHEKESGDLSLLNTPLNTKETEEYARIARIIKLADLFDIILRNNVIKNKDNPFVGIGRQIDTMVASSFVNARLANVLKTLIPIYQVGMKVLLSDGTIGVISENDPNDYNNPSLLDLSGNEIDYREESIYVVRKID